MSPGSTRGDRVTVFIRAYASSASLPHLACEARARQIASPESMHRSSQISSLRRSISEYNLPQVIFLSRVIFHELQPLSRRSTRQGIGPNGQEAGLDTQR